MKSVNLQGVAELRGKAAGSLQSDNVLAESGARRLASALSSQPLSINFRRTDGTLEACGRDLVPAGRGIFPQIAVATSLETQGCMMANNFTLVVVRVCRLSLMLLWCCVMTIFGRVCHTGCRHVSPPLSLVLWCCLLVVQERTILNPSACPILPTMCIKKTLCLL